MENMTHTEYTYWLCNIKGIGNKKISKIIKYFGTPEQAFLASALDIEKTKILSNRDTMEFNNSKDESKIKLEVEALDKSNIKFVWYDDLDYPEKLKNIYDPPMCLYVKGNLPDPNQLSIAIIGTRDCTAYGKEKAMEFSIVLAKMGINVISGLARGIDGYAHQGALRVDGSTFGVLGNGIDYCYPRENINLYYQMQHKGGVISEYPPKTIPRSGNFPMRNRIISGLADGILVVEAKEKSGSLITTDFGLEHGKDVFAIPGRIDDMSSIGCNRLIQMGAKCTITPLDILEDYAIHYENTSIIYKKDKDLLETNEKIVYANLGLEAKHLEQIRFDTKLSTKEVMESLFSLEMKDYIMQTTKNYYAVLPN